MGRRVRLRRQRRRSVRLDSLAIIRRDGGLREPLRCHGTTQVGVAVFAGVFALVEARDLSPPIFHCRRRGGRKGMEMEVRGNAVFQLVRNAVKRMLQQAIIAAGCSPGALSNFTKYS